MSRATTSFQTPLSLSDRINVALWKNALTPFFSFIGGIPAPRERVSELRYGDLKDEKLDIITPASGIPERVPVVFIHGGGRISGSKGRFYNLPLLGLADAGHRVFSLNYPLAPELPHPFALRSLLRALVTLKSQGHLSRGMHLVGDSAGGNLAVMLGLIIKNPALLRLVDFTEPETLPQVSSTNNAKRVSDLFLSVRLKYVTTSPRI